MKRVLNLFRPAWPPFLLLLLLPSCRTVAPAALDLAQHATAPYYFHLQGNIQGKSSGSLLGLGLPAGASGEVSLRERADDGPKVLWSATIDAGVYRGYRLVARRGAIDLVGLTCDEALDIWQDVGPCDVQKGAREGEPPPRVLHTIETPED